MGIGMVTGMRGGMWGEDLYYILLVKKPTSKVNMGRAVKTAKKVQRELTLFPYVMYIAYKAEK